MIYVIATLETKPDRTDAVKHAALPLIRATQVEDGCIAYQLHADIEKPSRLVFVETWESRDHLEAHFKTAHIAEFGQAIESAVISQRLEIIDPKHVEVS